MAFELTRRCPIYSDNADAPRVDGGWLKLEGYRLEKKGDDSYHLINARFNVAVYQLNGVS